MRALPQLLLPPRPATERPPPDSGAGRYIRTFLFERLVVGALGLLLPFMLIFVDRYLFHGHPYPRASESAYYYSGMREWFVISVATSGFFLIAYKITESNLENLLSVVAGICAVIIPIFPTARTHYEKHHPHQFPKTPLQKLLTENAVRDVHFIASFIFVLGLAGVIILFGLRSSGRAPRGHAAFWRYYHFTCAGVIGLAIVWTFAAPHIGGHPKWYFLAGETACALAFGASWFAKGWEIDYLLGRHRTSS